MSRPTRRNQPRNQPSAPTIKIEEEKEMSAQTAFARGTKRPAPTDPQNIHERMRLKRMSMYMANAYTESDADQDVIQPYQVFIGFVTNDPIPRRLVTARIRTLGGLEFDVMNMTVESQPFKPTEKHFEVLPEHATWIVKSHDAARLDQITIVPPNCGTYDGLQRFVFDNMGAELRESWGWSSPEEVNKRPWLRGHIEKLSIMEKWEKNTKVGDGGGIENVKTRFKKVRKMLVAVRAAEKKLSTITEGLFEPPIEACEDMSTQAGQAISTIIGTQAALFKDLLRIRAIAGELDES